MFLIFQNSTQVLINLPFNKKFNISDCGLISLNIEKLYSVEIILHAFTPNSLAEAMAYTELCQCIANHDVFWQSLVNKQINKVIHKVVCRPFLISFFHK